MDLSILDDEPYGRQSSVSSVRSEIHPGNQPTDKLKDRNNGVYAVDAEYMVMCDSHLYDPVSYDRNYFVEVASNDPFTNPFEAKTLSAFDDASNCYGCLPWDQFSNSTLSTRMMWFYLTEQERKRDWITSFSSSINKNSLNEHQHLFDKYCGKVGVGMDIFEYDGCDALSNDFEPEISDESGYPMPSPPTDECKTLYNKDDDGTCTSNLKFVLPDSLACSGRLPSLCRPQGTPARKATQFESLQERMQNDFNTNPQKDINDMGYEYHGFRPDVNLAAPNNWIGVSSTDRTTRSAYFTNARNPTLPKYKKAVRKSTVHIFATERFLEAAPIPVPCVYSIDYSPCLLASHEEKFPSQASGGYRITLSPSEPPTSSPVPYRDFVGYAGDVTCTSALDRNQDDDIVKFSAAQLFHGIGAFSSFTCTLNDKKKPTRDSDQGILVITAYDGIPVLVIPLMSCDQHNAFAQALDGITTNLTYTPYYPSDLDPCNGIPDALETRKGPRGLTPEAIDPRGDDINFQFPANNDDEDVTNDDDGFITDPLPTPTPTPTILVEIPGADPDISDDDESLGPNKGATPTPTASAIPTIINSIYEAENVESSQNPENYIWLFIITGVAVSVLCICICCSCYISRKSDKKAYGDLDTYSDDMY